MSVRKQVDAPAGGRGGNLRPGLRSDLCAIAGSYLERHSKGLRGFAGVAVEVGSPTCDATSFLVIIDRSLESVKSNAQLNRLFHY